MDRPHFRKTFETFFTPKAVIPFLIGSVCLAVLGNAVFSMCTSLIGAELKHLLAIAFGALLVFIGAVASFFWLTGRPGTYLPLPDPRRVKPMPRRGLIFLIGQKEACEEAVRHHQAALERVWLICSPQTNDRASAIANELSEGGKRIAEVRVVRDVNDPFQFYAMVRDLYAGVATLGWSVDDVIADYTGMTAHASVGMVLACLHAQAPLQYTPAERDDSLNVIRALPPFEMILQGRTETTPAKPAGVTA